jgi:PKD repeat protein
MTGSGNTPTPWQITTTNTSTGVAPIDYQWWLPDGSQSNDVNPGFTFSQPGVYGICLTILSDSGYCTSTFCDTIVVDSMGYVSTNTVWYDCTGQVWGPNVPGTPCTTALGQGTWTSDCVCVLDTTPETCQANFYVIQAYTDSTNNPGGGSEPIPNEVWVWNLSTGGNGDAQYLWSFGDGSSSTEAYPTHEYDGPGPWNLCLTIATGNCTSTYCDSVSVDANGMLNGMVIDGHTAASNHRTNGFTLNVQQPATSGITETPAIADLRLWPNPAQNELNLSFSNAWSGTASVTVIDPSGRLVISEDRNLTAGSNTILLKTGSLEPGLYMVRIGNAAHSVTHRFMKVR